MSFVWAGLALLGCEGDKDREIPMWQDGVLVQGDCPEEVAGVDVVGETINLFRGLPYVPYDEPLPEPYGDVATNEDEFDSLSAAIGLIFYYPPDFDTEQVGFVWARGEDTCAYEHVETHVKSKIGGGSVLDVTLRDPAMGCGDDSCKGMEGQYLVIQSFPNDEPGSICLRIEPGCE
jgi:hypothetical protein